MAGKINIETYKNMLETHDWYYEYSDDPSVYSSGRDSYKKLCSISKQSEEHLELFEQYRNEKFELN